MPLAILPVPFVAPLVPDLSDAVPLILCEQANKTIAHSAIKKVLRVRFSFIAICFL